jgi:hypothetical protein
MSILMLLAALFSPFLAVFAQSRIEIIREKRGQKLWVFRTLMATRGNRVSLDHVQALNSIELFFHDGSKYKDVLKKWNEYLDHFSQDPKPEDPDYPAKISLWVEKCDDFLADLLQTMGNSLGYSFDKVKIKRGIYFPKGHYEEQNDLAAIRKGMVQVFTGKEPLPVQLSKLTER